ncbi:MAG: hypothetical protein IRZ33_05565 [Alicyclobacillaceae bacterium]|nr:hypothetical protein [Alicyclobacillaceae bacterium]
MTRKSRTLTFVLSWLPGLGHLYLGLNKRGLQFMGAFFACIILNPLLPFVFPFVLAILWFCCLFDALQKVAVVNEMASRQGSSPISEQPDGSRAEAGSNTSDLDQTILSWQALKEHNPVNPAWIGGVYTVVGLLALMKDLAPNVWETLVSIHIGSILFAVALIGFGLWLIRTYVKKG